MKKLNRTSENKLQEILDRMDTYSVKDGWRFARAVKEIKKLKGIKWKIKDLK